MKKGMLTLMVLMIMAPPTLMAQAEPPDEFFGPRGHGQMGSGHPGSQFDGSCFSPGDRGSRGNHGDRIGHLLMIGDKIGLTDQQRDQFKQMKFDFQMQQIDRRAELKKAQLQLRTLMHDTDAVERDVMRMIDDVSQLKAEMQKMRYSHRQQIHGILTDEQVAKLKELRQDRMSNRGDKMRQGMEKKGGRHHRR